MKQLFLIILLTCSAQALLAQVLKADQLRMNGYTIHGFSNDATLADSATIELVTEAAVKAALSEKGRIDSLVLLQDSILVAYDFGGSEVWRDTIAGTGGGLSELPERAATTGTNVTFSTPQEYGSETSPITTRPITVDLTNAKFFQQIMWHQANVPPTFNPGSYEISGTYWTAKLNMIRFEVISPTRYNIIFNQ